MASITLTGKVKDLTVSSSTSQDNAAWTNCFALWPFWDSALGVSSATWTDVLGNSGTFTNTGGADFSAWTTGDANIEVGLARTGHNNLDSGLSQGATGFGGATQTHVFVIKPNLTPAATTSQLIVALGTDTGQSPEISFDATGHITATSPWPDTAWTSSGTVADNEWHTIGIAFDATAKTVSICVDGGTVDHPTWNSSAHFILSGNQARIWRDIRTQDYGQHAFAFWGAWSVKQSDAWLQDHTNQANNKPYKMIIAGASPATSIDRGFSRGIARGIARGIR